MKKILFATLLFISVSAKLCAQSFETKTGIVGNYQIAQFQMENLPKQGYTLELGEGNKLFIPRASYTRIGTEDETNALMDSSKNILNIIKDSLSNSANSRIVVIRFSDKGQFVSIKKQSPSEQDFWFNNNSKVMIKRNQDTLIIEKRVLINNKPMEDLFVFSLNDINDFSNVVQSDLIGKFINKINNDLPQEITREPVYKKFITGNYTINNGTLSGKMDISSNRRSIITLGISADVQNVKNYFVPSASVAIDCFNMYKNYNGSTNSLGVSWNPYFFFSKDINGNTKTYRNDFVFLNYTSITDKDSYNKFNIYLPLSIGYLIHRDGNFLDKHTFALNIFGVKYGNATLKPFFYFYDFFKGVTPSIQLSIGIGK